MRKLPVLLGALLMISIMAYGTRAYFTDSAKTDSNIQLELGNVAVGIIKESTWKVKDKNQTANQTTSPTEDKLKKTSTFKNAKPGDKFKKTFTIENEGTLNQKVDIAFNKLSENDYFNFEFVDGMEQKQKIEILKFKPNERKQYTVELTVKESGSKEEFINIASKINSGNNSRNNDQETTDLENIKDFITVEAEQLNSNKNTN